MKMKRDCLQYHKTVLEEAGKETIFYYIKDLRNLVGNFVIALLSGSSSAIISYFRHNMMIDWSNVIWSVAIGFIGWGIIVFLYNLWWKIPAKLFKEKENELEKITWDNVLFSLVPYSMIGYGSGCALRIRNNKPIDFGKLRIRAEIKQMYIDHGMTLNNAGRSLQYIDKTMGRVEEKVKECYFVSPPIEQGASVDFVLTKEIENNPYPVYHFDTYPEKDIPWPFDSSKSTQPEVVIECEVQGNIEVGNENWGLPHIKKYFQVMSDGQILDYQN